jgi:hypothetical protein
MHYSYMFALILLHVHLAFTTRFSIISKCKTHSPIILTNTESTIQIWTIVYTNNTNSIGVPQSSTIFMLNVTNSLRMCKTILKQTQL